LSGSHVSNHHKNRRKVAQGILKKDLLFDLFFEFVKKSFASLVKTIEGSDDSRVMDEFVNRYRLHLRYSIWNKLNIKYKNKFPFSE